jgi:enoyl-CoA hydratase/carnithine racemase
MNYHGKLLTDRKGRVAIITLNRPESGNSMDYELEEGLVDTIKGYDTEDEIGAIVIKGAGRMFCSGHDFDGFLRGETVHDYRRLLQGINDVADAVIKVGKIVIAQVHGYASAGGCQLAAVCDLVVASEEAKFLTPGINAGFPCIPPFSSNRQFMHKKKALEMMVTGEAITAHEAQIAGLVNRVVPLEKLEEATMELAETIASKSPITIRFAKLAYYSMFNMNYSACLEYAREMASLNCFFEDESEGIAAFFEKRKPVWRNR